MMSDMNENNIPGGGQAMTRLISYSTDIQQILCLVKDSTIFTFSVAMHIV